MQTSAEAIGTVLAVLGIIASVVALLTTGDAVWRLVGVGVIFVCIVFLALVVSPFGAYPMVSKVVACVGATLLVAGLMQPTGTRWLRESAAARLTGELVPPRWTGGDGFKVHIGPTVLDFNVPPGTPQMVTMYDSRLLLERGPSGVKISTTIRDRGGNVIVQVDKNRWQVAASPLCYDKNYSATSLEVKDRRDHVILQLALLGDGIRLQAEWHDDLQHGLMIRESPDPAHPGALMEIEGPKHVITSLIPPIFKYPSSEYLGQYTDDVKAP